MAVLDRDHGRAAAREEAPGAEAILGKATGPALQAGIARFGLVFAAGFMLGTPRGLLLEPRFGSTWVVAAEIPAMLVIAWAVCRRLVAGFDPPDRADAPAVMGGTGFALLTLTEGLFGALAFGWPVAVQVAELGTAPRALGLAVQFAFELMPLLQRVGSR